MAHTKATITSYADAEHFLNGGRSKTSRNFANNTYVERRSDDLIAIRLHQTDVVTFSRSGLVTISTGGWNTLTTRDRINAVLPRGWRVFTVKGSLRFATSYDGESIPFVEGLTIQRDTSTVLNAPTPSQDEALTVAKKALDRSIKRYITKVRVILPKWQAEIKANGGLSVGGDPWCCTMGVGAEGSGHLHTHLQDGYVFPTLFRKAYEHSHYSNPVRTATEFFLQDVMLGFEDRLVKALRKYLQHELDPQRTAPTAADAELLRQYAGAAKEVLRKPEDFGYFGDDDNLWHYSAPTWTKTRDSDSIEVANFEIVWETLKEQFPDLFSDDLDEDGHPDRSFNSWPAIYVFGAGHWMVGHIDQIVVPVVLDRDRPVGPTNLHPAFIKMMEFRSMTEMYPALPGAEERAAKADTEAELADIRTWMDYLTGTEGWFFDATEADVSTAIAQDLVEDYDWSARQVKRALVVLAEAEAYNDAVSEGQGTLL